MAGVAVFGLLAWRSVEVEQAEPNEALGRFTEIRNRFTGSDPILRVDAEGRIVRRNPPERETGPPKHLRVLTYRASEQRLVYANIAFWFLTVKGPAVQFSLRGTGLDLNRLGITPGDLKRYGPCLVLDEARADGSRLLVWTE